MSMIRFETPMGLLGLLVPLLWFCWLKMRGPARKSGVPFPSEMLVKGLPVTWRQRLRWLPKVLCLLAWCGLCIALARPQLGQEMVGDATKGIAIEMVIDKSGSMEAPMEYKGKVMTRLEVVKKVFIEFVLGSEDGKLPGRPDDLVGAIAFARYPSTLCPLTLDHGALEFASKGVSIAEKDERSTAIGDAVALAVARLHDAERTMSAQTGKDQTAYQIKSKVIIVLTDGQDEGERTRTIQEAAELAKRNGIRVYSIAIGSEPPAQAMTVFGMPIDMPQFEWNTTEIENLAVETGGIFRKVSDGEELAAVYHEIDDLEKSEMESIRFVTHRELFTPFALAALMCLCMAWVLETTWLRRTV